tara:strand:+ start:1403 stop:1864 length:462 start_codon:yes stop_codon:yes gene_type:complete
VALLPFRQQAAAPKLPERYSMSMEFVPDGASINALLEDCGDQPHPVDRWPLALQRSIWHLSILEDENRRLVGFVRATSDQALNANLWNLAAAAGPDQARLLSVLVHRSLACLRKDLPGCSISIAAPAQALDALKSRGFILDPGGIRAMGLRLR